MISLPLRCGLGPQRILANLQGVEDLTGTHQALPHRPQQNLPTKGQTVGKTWKNFQETRENLVYYGIITGVIIGVIEI